MVENFKLPVVKLTGEATYDEENDLWRLPAAKPEGMAAALIVGSARRHILNTQSHDQDNLRELIHQKREIIQLCVSTAEVLHWPKEMGVHPEWRDGRNAPE